MIRFIIQRLLLAIPVLLGVTFIIFTLTYVLPGDPARSAADRYATPEQVEAVRIALASTGHSTSSICPIWDGWRTAISAPRSSRASR